MTGFTEEHREQLEWAADAMSFSDAYPSLAEALTAALSALDARAERIRELEGALKVIRDHGTKEGHDCWALHQGDCADLFQETARAALRSDTAPHEGQTWVDEGGTDG